ncbi:MAG: histidine phosphatase family protein [Gaiellaceae bacterium]
MRLFVLARHAESVLNHQRRINGDPSVPAPLTEHGRAEAALLGLEVRSLPLDVCMHTRFGRTVETAQIAMDGRDVPIIEEALFDDVNIGDLEGETIDEYHAWKRKHVRSDRFPGGESLVETALRYVEAYRRLLAAPYRCALVVCHEIPIRYALNAVGESGDLDGPVHTIPNATPFLFDDAALEKAAAGVEHLATAPSKTRSPS